MTWAMQNRRNKKPMTIAAIETRTAMTASKAYTIMVKVPLAMLLRIFIIDHAFFSVGCKDAKVAGHEVKYSLRPYVWRFVIHATVNMIPAKFNPSGFALFAANVLTLWDSFRGARLWASSYALL